MLHSTRWASLAVERISSRGIFAYRLCRPERCLSIWLGMSKSRLVCGAVLAIVAALGMAGCHDHPSNPVHAVTQGTAVVAVDLAVPTHVEMAADTVAISAARNSWTQFVLQLDCSQFPPHPVLRLPKFAGVSMSAYQVLSVPVDLNDASCVRQTGEPGRTRPVPRVLLPLSITDDQVDLLSVRDPASPQSADHHPTNGSVLIWIDLQIAPQTAHGDLDGDCELTDDQGRQSAGSVPIRLTVENLTLPTQPHLHFTAPLNWPILTALHPGEFEGVTPRLLSRADPRRAALVNVLDQYLQLAHENKADLYVPRLQPIVKWPLAKPPEADWSGFDSITRPWLTGSAFSDHLPVGFWPLPVPDSLVNFDLNSQIQYWQVAAAHFDQLQWLDRAPVILRSESPGPITEAAAILLCAEARLILTAQPHITTMLPLQQDQLQLTAASSNSANPLPTERLLTVTPGLICDSPIRDWPSQLVPPRHWMDATAADGSLDVTGLASEEGVRTLAWLAFSRDASLILCGNPLPPLPALPSDPDQPAPAKQLIWCYPGQWFGIDRPLATVQLKWMRQAEQDYEYLYLAGQNRARDDALRMCRLITKPVQLQPAQKSQPLFNLLAGSTDPRASEEARQLLVERLTQQPDATTKPIETDPVALQSLRWFEARQRPTLVATGVQWIWDTDPGASNVPAPGAWIDARVDVDLFNPAPDMATGGSLQWTVADGGFEIHPQPIDVPALAQYQVKPVTTTARFDLNKISADSRQPLQLSYIDGFTGQTVPCRFVLPVATSERRQQPLTLDGVLDDWFPADALQLDQPLVRMLNRPTLQSQDLQMADTPTSVYSSWSDENFYLAFRVAGVASTDLASTRNFVQYDHGRAWGEDLCELLIQPVYIDNTVGPTLHVVCKPGGNWVEQQQPGKDDWQPFEASGIRYAATIDSSQKIWRGEVAIPWKAIAALGRGRPGLLRFNFIQHQQSNAQSASWAGPIDQSRDGRMAGLLLLKEP